MFYNMGNTSIVAFGWMDAVSLDEKLSIEFASNALPTLTEQANLDDAQAQESLGRLYHTGLAVNKNYKMQSSGTKHPNDTITGLSWWQVQLWTGSSSRRLQSLGIAYIRCKSRRAYWII